MKRIHALVLCAALAAGAGGCVSGGVGDLGTGLGGGEEEEVAANEMPTDTYDNCTAGPVEGVNFLSSGNGGGSVSLGMSECELINVLGNPDQAIPGSRPGTRRFVTLTYSSSDGSGTEYVFVDNALKEMNRISTLQQTAPQAAPPG